LIDSFDSIHLFRLAACLDEERRASKKKKQRQKKTTTQQPQQHHHSIFRVVDDRVNVIIEER
jgi:hypothetical protein